MKQTFDTARDEIERLAEMIAECLTEADRLGLGMVAIDLDQALQRVRRSPSNARH